MIQLEKIKKYYGQGDNKLWVLKDISLTIQEGEFTAIMGPSGSGKSSLMNTISFLDGDFSGNYFFNSEQVYQYDDKKLSLIRNNTVGFVFQSFNLIENYTAYENVELPLLYGGYTHKEIRLRVLEMLKKLE